MSPYLLSLAKKKTQYKPSLSLCSPNTILRNLSELAEDYITYTSEKGIAYCFNTANLPTKYTSEYIETETGEQPYSNSKSYTLAYTLNSNGTIDTEQRDNGRTIQYGYSNVTRAAMMANEVEAQLPVLKNMLFKRHRG